MWRVCQAATAVGVQMFAVVHAHRVAPPHPPVVAVATNLKALAPSHYRGTGPPAETAAHLLSPRLRPATMLLGDSRLVLYRSPRGGVLVPSAEIPAGSKPLKNRHVVLDQHQGPVHRRNSAQRCAGCPRATMQLAQTQSARVYLPQLLFLRHQCQKRPDLRDCLAMVRLIMVEHWEELEALQVFI